MSIRILEGDNRAILPTLDADSIDACVTDPPYALTSIVKRFANSPRNESTENTENPYGRTGRGFMGKTWDTGEVAFDPAFWSEVYRVLKPGAHLLAFGGTRGHHRMFCAIEDAGFEIRDCLSWLYGSGFPKSHDVSKAIDKAAGAEREVIAERYTTKRLKPGATVEREGAWGKQDVSYTATDTAPATDAAAQWQGWGTALKPAWEPICLARKPLIGTVAANVLEHGTGAINVDACRVEGGETITTHSRGTTDSFAKRPGERTAAESGCITPQNRSEFVGNERTGRWPANVVHDGSEEVVGLFPSAPGQQGDLLAHNTARKSPNGIYGEFGPARDRLKRADIDKSAARFFYSAKATKADRAGSKHPTVKPVKLMRWLVRLVTPPGGVVLDPFAGSGTTGRAAVDEGFGAILIEREAEYLADIRRRFNKEAAA